MFNNIRIMLNWEDEFYLNLGPEERMKYRIMEEIKRRWGSPEKFLQECKVNVEKVKNPVFCMR